MRVPAAILIFAALASFGPPGPYVPDFRPASFSLAFTPVTLDQDAPGRRRIGRLIYLGGWWVRATDPRFGGLSALHVDKGHAVAVSDAGYLLRFSLPPAATGKAVAQAIVRGPGNGFRKRNRDAESLALAEGGLWIGYERYNAVWRYDPATLAAQAHVAPRAMAAWERNSGPEAMARLADGRFLLFEEADAGRDGTTGLVLFDGDPAVAGMKTTPLRYRPPPGYRPTDAALLPDGRIAVLNRAFSVFSGFAAKVVAARLGPGGLEEQVEWASFAPPVVTDNYEALAVTQENGRTILWMASDDNYNPLQRTLLLKFAVARD